MWWMAQVYYYGLQCYIMTGNSHDLMEPRQGLGNPQVPWNILREPVSQAIRSLKEPVYLSVFLFPSFFSTEGLLEEARLDVGPSGPGEE